MMTRKQKRKFQKRFNGILWKYRHDDETLFQLYYNRHGIKYLVKLEIELNLRAIL